MLKGGSREFMCNIPRTMGENFLIFTIPDLTFHSFISESAHEQLRPWLGCIKQNITGSKAGKMENVVQECAA